MPPEETTYIEAIRQALFESMREDKRVFCLGQDIGAFGGAFKATKGLLEEFGRARVIDTPIAESGMLGLGIGAALCGMRPVVEMQFADFVTNAFTQIVYNAAKAHYRWGQAVPLVVRLPCGGGLSAGPFHSTNPEAWFCHVPGLKVVAPSSASDARALLKASILDNNPVIFLEHKWLYRREKEVLRDEAVAIGAAKVVKTGNRATVVTYGSMVPRALEAAEDIGDIEVVDLRTLLPWDKETVARSIQKTSRLLVVHEATKTGGFGAEIAASIGERYFQCLDAPVARLASQDTPVPFAKPLEEYFMPSAEKITAALRDLLEY